jgi:hypothetical protein
MQQDSLVHAFVFFLINLSKTAAINGLMERRLQYANLCAYGLNAFATV